MTSDRNIAANYKRRQTESGYTLLELLVVMVIVGIMAALVAPGWNAFYSRLRLGNAIDMVYQGMRDAEGNARRQHLDWQVSIREVDGVVQWAMHPASVTPGESEWRQLDPAIKLGKATLRWVKDQSLYKVEFSHKGQVNGQLGRVSLTTKNNEKIKRCVVVSTLLGHLRTDEDKGCP